RAHDAKNPVHLDRDSIQELTAGPGAALVAEVITEESPEAVVLVAPHTAFGALLGAHKSLAEARRVVWLEQIVGGVHIEGTDGVLGECRDEDDRLDWGCIQLLEAADARESGSLGGG